MGIWNSDRYYVRLKDIDSWHNIQDQYDKFVDHYNVIIAAIDTLTPNPYFSNEHIAAARQELQRLIEAADKIITSLNQAEFYNPSQKNDLGVLTPRIVGVATGSSIPEAQLLQTGSPSPASFTVDELNEKIGELRQAYLRLWDSYSALLVPYTPPPPPLPSFFQVYALQLRIAAGMLGIVLAYVLLVNFVYDRGIQAATNNAYDEAITHFSFVKRFGFWHSNTDRMLEGAYTTAINNHIRAQEYPVARTLANDFFYTRIDDAAALSLVHKVYFSEAQSVAALANGIVGSSAVTISNSSGNAAQATDKAATAVPEGESGTDIADLTGEASQTYKHWKEVDVILTELKNRLDEYSEVFNEQQSAPAEIEFAQQEKALLIQTYVGRGELLKNASQWEAVRQLTREAALPFTWADDGRVRLLYLDSLELEARDAFARTEPDWSLIERNVNELISLIDDSESRYILARTLLASYYVDQAIPFIQPDNQNIVNENAIATEEANPTAADTTLEAVSTEDPGILPESIIDQRWEQARVLLAKGREILPVKAVQAIGVNILPQPVTTELKIEDYISQRDQLSPQLLTENNNAIVQVVSLVNSTLNNYTLLTYYEPAKQLFGQKRYPDAQPLYKNVVDVNPDFLDARNSYFDTYYIPAEQAFDQQDYAEARTLFDALILAGGRDYLDTGLRQKLSYYLPSVNAISVGDYNSAEPLLTRLYDIDDTFDHNKQGSVISLLKQTLLALGEQAIAEARFSDAETYLERLNGIDPAYPDLLLRLSQTYREIALGILGDTDREDRFEAGREVLLNLQGINPGYNDVETLIRNTYYDPIVLKLAPAFDHPDAKVCQEARTQIEDFVKIDSSAIDFRDTRLLLNETWYCEARAKIAEAEAQTSQSNIINCDNKNYESARTAIRNLRLDSNYRDLNQLVIETFYNPAVEAYRIAFLDPDATERQQTSALNCARSLLGDLTANQDYYLLYYQDAGLLYRTTFYIPAYRAYQTALTTFESRGQNTDTESQWQAARTSLAVMMSQDASFAPPSDFLVEGSTTSLGQLLSAETLPSVGEMYFNTYYLPALAAFNNQAWDEAQTHIAALQTDPVLPQSYYSGAIFVLRSSYYVPGRDAFNQEDWATARTHLESLVFGLNSPDFKPDITSPAAAILLKDTYAIPAGQVYDALKTDYNHPEWDTFLLTLQNLINIDPDYKQNLPLAASLLLREALYQRANLAETTAKNETTDVNEQVNAWQITLNSLVTLLELDADPTVAFPNLLKDVPTPYRDAQDRLRDVFHWLADSALKARNWDAARQAAQQLLSYDAGDELANDQLRQSYYMAGVDALNQSDWQTAIDEFTPLLLLNKPELQDNPFTAPPYRDENQHLLTAYHNLAQQFLDNRRYEDSRQVCIKLLTYLPDDAKAGELYRETYYQQGVTALDNGEFANARIFFSTLLQIDASNPANFLISDTSQYRDANQLYRETYYRPARANIEESLWNTAREDIQGLLVLDPTDPTANDIVIESYLQPANEALKADNWRTAQHTFAELFQPSYLVQLANSPSYYDAVSLYMDAYLRPAKNAIQDQDWTLARTSARSAIEVGLSLFIGIEEDDKLTPSLTDAQQTLTDAYALPINQALEKQDWQAARDIISGLYRDINQATIRVRPWIVQEQTAEIFLLNTYIQPVEVAIGRSDLATANQTINDLIYRFPTASGTIARLRIRLFNQPLYDAVQAKDWVSAADLYDQLRQQPVLAADLDAILYDLPELRQALVARFIPFWVSGDLSKFRIYHAIASTPASMTVDSSGRQVQISSIDGEIYFQPLPYNTGPSLPGAIFKIETGSFVIDQMVMDPHGKWLATTHEDHLVRIWERESGQLLTTLTGHSNRITAIALSNDGTRLVTGDQAGLVQLWDTADFGTSLSQYTLATGVTGLGLSPDGTTLVAATFDNQLSIWQHNSEIPVEVSADLTAAASIQHIVFQPDGQRFITAGHTPQIYVWGLDGTLTQILQGHNDWVRSVLFIPGSHFMITSGDDGVIMVWDMLLGEVINQSYKFVHPATDLALSVDARLLIATFADGNLIIWNAQPQD